MKLLIIDSNALLHRSFHALPPLKNSKGIQTGAVYGFFLTLFKAIDDIEPDHIAATFDTPVPTFRHKKFEDYKAGRQKPPDEFYEQIPLTKKVLSSFSIPILEKEGFEADDVIATISKKALLSDDLDVGVYVVTGDLDTLQLVNEKVKVYTLGRGVRDTVIYDNDKVMNRFELAPCQMVDLKALAGDASDNIPGAPGIGEKTAIRLLKSFKNIDNLYEEIENKSSNKIKPRINDILIKNKEQVFFSRMLAQTREDVSIDFDIKKCKFSKFDREKAEETLKEFEFYSLIKRLPRIDHQKENLAGRIKLW